MALKARTAEELVDHMKKRLRGMDVKRVLRTHGQVTADAIHRSEQNGGLPLVDEGGIIPEKERPSF